MGGSRSTALRGAFTAYVGGQIGMSETLNGFEKFAYQTALDTAESVLLHEPRTGESSFAGGGDKVNVRAAAVQADAARWSVSWSTGHKFQSGSASRSAQLLYSDGYSRPFTDKIFGFLFPGADPLNHTTVDFFAAFGDLATLGGTKSIRQFWKFDAVDYDSGGYFGGTIFSAAYMSVITGGASIAQLPRATFLANTYMLGGVGTSFANDPTGAAITNASLATAVYSFGRINPLASLVANMFAPNVGMTHTVISEFWPKDE